MAKRYFYVNPRGFSNEYTIYSVDSQSDAEIKIFDLFIQYYPKANWHRISYKDAYAMTAHNRKLYREYKRAGLNYYVGATEITPISREYSWLLTVDIPL